MKAIPVPEEINTFPQGDATVVAVPVSFLNQLTEEIEILKAEVFQLKQNYNASIQELKAVLADLNTRIAILARQNTKIWMKRCEPWRI